MKLARPRNFELMLIGLWLLIAVATFDLWWPQFERLWTAVKP